MKVAESDKFNSVGCNPTTGANEFSDAESVEITALIIAHFQRADIFANHVGWRSLAFTLPDSIKFVAFSD